MNLSSRPLVWLAKFDYDFLLLIPSKYLNINALKCIVRHITMKNVRYYNLFVSSRMKMQCKLKIIS